MYAIYFEFKKENGEAYQALFIPATALSTHTIMPTYAYKHLTPLRPRRVWDVKSNPSFVLTSEVPSDISVLMRHEIKQLEGLHVYITSVLQDPDWKSVGCFPVDVTTTDLLALKETANRMPSTLNARIKTLREYKQFPALPEGAS